MTKTIIAGLDVGKNSSCLVGWDADSPISNPKDFFDYESEFICLIPDLDSVNKIISLKPCNGQLIVFLEPTGSDSRVWVNNLRDAGIEVHLFPHNLVNSSRLALCNWNDKDVKEGIGNGEQGTGGLGWGFIPKREEGTGKRKQEKLFAFPSSLFPYLMKHTTYGSGGLLLPDREQEIGKTVRCSLFPVRFFDEHDAVVLLVLAQKWLREPNSVQLIGQKEPIIKELNDLYLDGESCNKVLNQLINRAGQKLHVEAPEIDDVSSNPTKNGEASPFWAWIAGEVVSLRSAARYAKRLAQSIGLAAKNGFSKQLISYAKSIVEWQLRRYQIDCRIRGILPQPKFARYIRIFNQFGAGTDTQAIQIFPFEQFLGSDGQPIIKIKRRGTKSGKPTLAHISCRKFHSAMGMAPNQTSEGEKKGEFISGSGACRMALWRLVSTQIETNSPSSLRNKFGKMLRQFLELDKNHRDELMHGLLTILADKTTGAETLAAVKRALIASGNPMGVTIAAGLDQKTQC
ncbi:hypothetical protein [Microseira sp. BLCC-F43]|jgi:hypothetical protein|uniref:IS110 family transposase n=1 Tax=Microseira sp. BLCC-F43 TaxID=3153602 RepID=UPI0035B8B2B3